MFVGVQVRDRDETARLVRTLRRHGLKTLDFSDNELAKLHVRHLVGGHAPQVENEILYRFEFPERPGALMKFLNSMSHGWNISLFHYRNHGADYGRVLVGMQVPPQDKRKFRPSSPSSAIPGATRAGIRRTSCSSPDPLPPPSAANARTQAVSNVYVARQNRLELMSWQTACRI